jgi:hypothetical protein
VGRVEVTTEVLLLAATQRRLDGHERPSAPANASDTEVDHALGPAAGSVEVVTFVEFGAQG